MKILSLCLAALLATGCVRGTGDQFLNAPAPDPLLYPLNGGTVRLSSLQGQKVALMFWSTQCSTSMGELKDLAKKFARDPHLADVVGIAINIDSQDREDKVLQYISEMPKSHLQYGFSANDIYDESYRLFDVSIVPQFFAINKHGVVKAEGLDADVISSYFRSH